MRIKLSAPGEYPLADLTQFLSPRYLDEVEFVLNDSRGEFDAWFVFEESLPSDREAIVPPNRVFFLGAETARPFGFFYETAGWIPYLAQFSKVYTSGQYYEPNGEVARPFLPWMVNANHGPALFDSHQRNHEFFASLELVDKVHALSVICSTKGLTPEHRARLRFVERLQDHFGERLHWFGNGINPIPEKWAGLAPYRFSIVLENHQAPQVLTEKIVDAFLCLTVPIYWGDPAIGEVFPKDSYIGVDLTDLHRSIEAIESALADDTYDRATRALFEARDTVLEELNFLHRIINIAKENELGGPNPKERVVLKGVEEFVKHPETRSNPLGRFRHHLRTLGQE